MRFRYHFTCLLTALSCICMAQSTVVPMLNYNSTTRDTVVQFPNGDHNQYKKILMHYSMRCKDGLVSTGSNTNLGCGEWDYSCNTNIVDSTQVDSLKQVAPDHVISGFSGEVYEYTSQPTYHGKQLLKKEVTYVSGEILETFSTNEATGTVTIAGTQRQRIISLIDKATIEANGFTPGQIGRMSLDVISGNGDLKNVNIRLQHTSASEVTPSLANSSSWREVYFGDLNLSTSNNFINLKDNFNWNGVSNIAMMISFDKADNGTLELGAAPVSNTITYVEDQDKYLQCGASGHLHLANGLPTISDEVTVSAWVKGNPQLPVNTTLFEGMDDNDTRQINVHLPWGNSRVYWDCGNDGSGYDRIEKLATDISYKNRWNHWAFTKNAVTGVMNIYLNGSLWHTGDGRYKSIDVRDLVIGTSQFSSEVYYPGAIDEFRIWAKELSESEIQEWMRKSVTADHPAYNDLVVYYDFNNYDGNIETDRSPSGNDAVVNGALISKEWIGSELVKPQVDHGDVAIVNFHKGDFQYNIEDATEVMLIENLPDRIDQYELQGTDRVLVGTQYYYKAGDQPVYNFSYSEIDQLNYPAEGMIEISNLEYYTKSPMVYELMSFVTPYGINLDLGLEGKTWTFDVTEFGPILKGNKRLFLNRGGQWQEDMDIRFEFIEGTPIRDIINIQQVWPVVQASYAQIESESRYEPRIVPSNEGAVHTELKAVITGHGQQGEFISRSHILYANQFPFPWDVWTECSDNPIYPQGGTWVYDRAGWCPGAPSDVERVNISGLVDPAGTEIDYGFLSFSNIGDSRYIANIQMVEYGAPNYDNEVELVDIVNPSDNVLYERYNPTCQAPIIHVRNNGSNDVTSINVNYGFEDDMDNAQTYTWTGNLSFLQEQEIELPYFSGLADDNDGRVFKVELDYQDEDPTDNSLTSVVDLLDHLSEDIVIEFKTNNAASETSYFVYDQNGNEIYKKIASGLNSNTTYRDTLRNMNGCFQLSIRDNGQDGLSWWANNDGSGYIRVKSVDGDWKSLPTDFGAGYQYSFTAGQAVSTEDVDAIKLVSFSPNPTKQGLFVELDNSLINSKLIIFDQLGRAVYEQKINEVSFYLDEVASLQSGLYQLSIVKNNIALTRRFIKQ